MVDKELAAQDLAIPRMTSYLEVNGWKRVVDNEHWRVFHGRKSKSGEHFEIALPKDVVEEDYRLHVHHAIKILSSLRRKTWESTANDIRYHDRDLLRVRIMDNDRNASLPYDVASKYVRYMKKLIQYSASSERNAKAHFKQPLSTGSKMIQHFRFGQTFRGSFGLLIESLVGQEQHYINKREQHQLPGEDFRILPLERRVLERIARGLQSTALALRVGDEELLKTDYGRGFNSKMCEAIRDMICILRSPYELSISWSQTLKPSSDVRDFDRVLLGREHLKYLESAIKHLRFVPQNKVTIKGQVVALSSSDNPLSETVEDRAIIVDWKVNRKRSRKVSMRLKRHDYIEADRAHMKWETISVTGMLQTKGSIWQLEDPENFKILNYTT